MVKDILDKMKMPKGKRTYFGNRVKIEINCYHFFDSPDLNIHVLGSYKIVFCPDEIIWLKLDEYGDLYLHKDDGPAVERPDGMFEWWWYGVPYLKIKDWLNKAKLNSEEEIKLKIIYGP